MIQSEPLKKVLGNVLHGYPGVTTSLERLEFSKPFKRLVHRWEALTKAREEEQDEITKKHVDLFYKILEEELRDTLDRKKTYFAMESSLTTSSGAFLSPVTW